MPPYLTYVRSRTTLIQALAVALTLIRSGTALAAGSSQKRKVRHGRSKPAITKRASPTPTPVETATPSPSVGKPTPPTSIETPTPAPSNPTTSPPPPNETRDWWDFINVQMVVKRDELRGPGILVFLLVVIFIAFQIFREVKARKEPEKMNKTRLKIGRWALGSLIAVILLANVMWLSGMARNSSSPVASSTPGGAVATPAGNSGNTGPPESLPAEGAQATPPKPTPLTTPAGAAQGTPPGQQTGNASPALTPPPTHAGNKVAASPPLPDATAGQTVSIQGTFEGQGAWSMVLTSVENPGVTIPVPAQTSEKKDSLSFILPNTIKDGRYRVVARLTTEGATPPPLDVPGELRVLKPAEAQVTVEAVRPISPYPNPQHVDKYDFEIAGTNFSSTLQNNHVEINGIPISVAYPPGMGSPSCTSDYQVPCLRAAAGNETQKLIVEGYAPPGYSSPLSVGVRVGVGSNVAKAPNPLLFSSISKTRLQIYSVGAFFLLIGIVFALVRAGIKLRKRGNESFGSLRAFLIDKETNSYSLSKFQLILFTLVTIFGYIYVFVCHLFVQWKFELPPVPEGLPSMMAVSVGTSVVAAGIGARIGGKGAGPESPSLSDFITSGGVVLPERFQFFLWTIVSSAGVLALILASDPVTVTQLPKLPDGLLYLMGLSSAGYLGGKLVRGPGPSIKSIDAARLVLAPAVPGHAGKPAIPARTAIEVTLTGDNLSPDGTFQLDDEKIPVDQVEIKDHTDDPQHKQFASMLKVQLKNVAERYFEGPHLLRIVNPDSQGADITFGSKVESVSSVQNGEEETAVTVTGANFKDPSKAEWTAVGADPKEITEDKITKKSDAELEIKLTPGPAGLGKLAIISPGDLRTTVDVPVA